MNSQIAIFVTILLFITISTAQWTPVPDSNPGCCEEYCYAADTNPNLFFGTRTAYEFVHGRNSRQHLVPQCRPTFYWSLNRHGTRLPRKQTIENLRMRMPKLKREIMNNYDVRKSYPQRGRLCYQDLDNLKSWNWDSNITVEYAKALTSQGKDDLKYLAKRYQTRFPNLLQIPYNDKDFVFKYTSKDRVETSFKSFVEGLFDSNAYQVQGTMLEPNDTLLGHPANCLDYESEPMKSDDTSEYSKFIKSNHYQKVIKDVSTKLGFRYTLNDSSVQEMYTVCAYEKAWYIKDPSPWCAVFTKEQLKIMEYAEDLFEYYQAGYGDQWTEKWGCNLVKDMMSYLDRVANNETGVPKAVISFTHKVRIQGLIAALGFEKDMMPLMADDYPNVNQRKWKTAKISLFSANLAVVFYECPKNKEKHVMFFLNEIPVEHPDCQVGLCKWQTVKDRLQPIVDGCNANPCDQSSSGIMNRSRLIFSLCLLVVIKFLF